MSLPRANASPTKAFFVRMLTRDISLDDCILDLVDNSIDGAWVESGTHPSSLEVDTSLEGFLIEISLSENEFVISDNCGGITLDDATEYAFTFGRRDDAPHDDDYTVGVYGIGMKRAVFKLGKQIEINSTYKADGDDLESFQVPIDVDNWVGIEGGDWDFDIEERDPDSEAGVSIRITELLEDAKTKFSDDSFQRSLTRVLARDYMVPLMRGLRIKVNELEVSGSPLVLRENENFAPMRDRYEDEGVDIEILAGMAFPPPDDREPDEQKHAADVSGWYILCNGRVILAADTTSLTGWGDSLPKWHKQYTGFVGVALFRASNPELLPMTTTKRSVDASSSVYRRALRKMQVPTRTWIDYTNSRKTQDSDTVDETEGDSAETDIFEVQRRPEIGLPTFGRQPSRETPANVHYSIPKRRLRALAQAFGDGRMSYRDVGLKSFEYTYDDLVDEGDN